jgi:hypothetical protein
MQRLMAEFPRLGAGRPDTATQAIGHVLKGCCDGIADVVRGARHTRGSTATEAFEVGLERPQAAFDLIDIGRDGPRVS